MMLQPPFEISPPEHFVKIALCFFKGVTGKCGSNYFFFCDKAVPDPRRQRRYVSALLWSQIIIAAAVVDIPCPPGEYLKPRKACGPGRREIWNFDFVR